MMKYEDKEFDMKNLPQFGSALVVLLLLCALPCRSSQQAIARNGLLGKISSAIHDQFGPNLKLFDDTSRYYLLGDFNGDGFGDIAVQVQVGKGMEDLKSHNVKYIDINPYNGSNGQEKDPVSVMWDSCAGVAVIHGTAAGWDTPAAKYIFFECFSDFRMLRKGRKIYRGAGSRGPTPAPKGDSIQLELENGGTLLVYWNGKTYRGFGQRGGD